VWGRYVSAASGTELPGQSANNNDIINQRSATNNGSAMRRAVFLGVCR